MNKKGFTLVELLAVIVILAVVMLIAVTSVGPMMEKSRKSSLGSEGLGIIKAADTAYKAEGLKGPNANYTSTSSVCYSIKYLCDKGYFEKGCGSDGYTGSVLVEYDNGKYNYTFWLSNGTYVFNAATKDNYGEIDDVKIVYNGTNASNDCGKTLPLDTPSVAVEHNTEARVSIESKTVVECNENCDGGSVVVNGGKTIPTGAKYTKNNGEVFNPGDTIPSDYEPVSGDTYEDEDYIYKYNGFYDGSWTFFEDQNGWAVIVKNQNKTSYGVLKTIINGKPLVSMPFTFAGCSNLINSPVIPSTVTIMEATFLECTSLKETPVIPNGVTSLFETFSGCTSLTKVNKLSDNLTNMVATFSGCTSLKEPPVIPNSVIDMGYAFNYCESLETAPIIPGNVKDMNTTFKGCTSLKEPPVIPNGVTMMQQTFEGCTSLINPPVIPNGVTSLHQAFDGCTSLKSAPVIPSSVTQMQYIFRNCTSLKGTITINTSSKICESALTNVAKDEAHRITISGSASSEVKNKFKNTAYNSGQYVTVN